MDTYDAELTPEPEAWLAVPEQERISLVLRAHKGCFPDALHAEGANEIMHAGLHAVIENQLALNEPKATARTLERLQTAGLKRHAALHLLMREMAGQLAALGDGGKVFDAAAWERSLNKLDAVSRPERPRPTPPGSPSGNRAQRRAAKKGR